MCIILDDRERDIAPELQRCDVDVVVSRLEFGDAMFSGNGPHGECLVGIERKRLSDLVNSMKDRRLAGFQIKGMQRSYDFCFLTIESVFRPGPHGEIEELHGRDWRPFYTVGKGSSAVAYRQLTAFVTTLELLGNLIVRRTSNMRETAAQIVALHHWFNDKEWDQHHSHDQIYTNTPEKGHGTGWGTPHAHDEEFGKYGRGRAIVVGKPPSTCWRMASQIPGIDRKAEVVAAHFGTVRAMVEAGEKEWQRIPGIGKTTARAAVRSIREEGA